MPPRARKRQRVSPSGEHRSSVSAEVVSVRLDASNFTEQTTEKAPANPRQATHGVLPGPSSQAGPSASANGYKEAFPDLSPSELVGPFCSYLIFTHLFSQAELEERFPDFEKICQEVLCLDVPPPPGTRCATCTSPAEYHCEDCFQSQMTCKGCLLSSHACNPLHKIQVSFLAFVLLSTLTCLRNRTATPSKILPSALSGSWSSSYTALLTRAPTLPLLTTWLCST